MLKHRIVKCICALVLICICTTGCTNIRFSTGLSGDEYAKYKGETYSVALYELLLEEQKFICENIFDENIWEQNADGMSMETYVMNLADEYMKSLIFNNDIAKGLQLIITDEDSRKIESAANEYCQSVNDADVGAVKDYFRLRLLSEKAYYVVTDDVDLEVSVDEARIISVQYVFVSDRELAESLVKELENGRDMISVATEYSEDETCTLEFGLYERDKAFEEAAFALEIGDISDIVALDGGYYIIKCVNDNVESDYEERRETIINLRRAEIFDEYYAKYCEGKTIEYNNGYRKKLSLRDIGKDNGMLETLFSKYFVSTQMN